VHAAVERLVVDEGGGFSGIGEDAAEAIRHAVARRSWWGKMSSHPASVNCAGVGRPSGSSMSIPLTFDGSTLLANTNPSRHRGQSRRPDHERAGPAV